MYSLQITVRAGHRCKYVARVSHGERSFLGSGETEAEAAEKAARQAMDGLPQPAGEGESFPYELKHIESHQDAEIYRVEW